MSLKVPPGFISCEEASHRDKMRCFVNVIGVIVSFTAPKIPKNGKGPGQLPKKTPIPSAYILSDWMMNFDLTDKSFGLNRSLPVRMFRPKDQLPEIHNVGDIVMLRNFKVSLFFFLK